MGESSKHEESRDARATNEQTLPERRTHRAEAGGDTDACSAEEQQWQQRNQEPVNGNQT